MHFVGIGIAIFAALWLWSWTERRRIARMDRPPRVKLTLDQRIGRSMTILACVLICGVVAAMIGEAGRHTNEAQAVPLSASDIAFLCRTGATVPGHCAEPERAHLPRPAPPQVPH